MGVTIHFDFECSGSKVQVKDKLEAIRKRILPLPVFSVGEVKELRWDNGYEDPDPDIRWAKIQYTTYKKVAPNREQAVFPQTGFIFTVLIGEGCEPVNIGLVRFKGSQRWSGGAFCKSYPLNSQLFQ